MSTIQIQNLTALTVASSDDVLCVVDNPLGTPLTKYITRANFLGGTNVEQVVGTTETQTLTNKTFMLDQVDPAYDKMVVRLNGYLEVELRTFLGEFMSSFLPCKLLATIVQRLIKSICGEDNITMQAFNFSASLVLCWLLCLVNIINLLCLADYLLYGPIEFSYILGSAVHIDASYINFN